MEIDSAHVIVVAVDLSPASAPAFLTALGLVRGRPRSQLHFVHVLSGELENAFAHDRIEEWSKQIPETMLEDVESEFHTMQGASPASTIVAKALELRADLIVVGTAGRRGLSRLVLGSVAEEVARTAPCAVLIARDKTS